MIDAATYQRTVQEFAQQKAPIKTQKGRFEQWIDGFTPGYFLGPLFILLAMAMVSIEVSRILTGSLNRNPLYSYALYPGNVYQPPFYSAANSYDVERRNQYLWPWSHPALLFSIPVLLAGLFGITSARRATYSMIYLFFVFSLVSMILMPFLIGYFAVNLFRHNSGFTTAAYDSNSNRDKSLTIVMLVISCIVAVLGFISTIVSGLGYNCCSTKGGAYLTPNKSIGYDPNNPASRPVVTIPQ